MNPFMIRMLSRNRASTPIAMDKRGGQAPRGFWIAITVILAILALALIIDVLRGKPDRPAATVSGQPTTPDKTTR